MCADSLPPPLNLLLSHLLPTHPSLLFRVDDVFSEKRDDPTSLTSVLRDTELVGLLRLLYAMLLHDGPPRHSSSPPLLPPHTLSISTACLKAINNFAILDLCMVQVGCGHCVWLEPNSCPLPSSLPLLLPSLFSLSCLPLLPPPLTVSFLLFVSHVWVLKAYLWSFVM